MVPNKQQAWRKKQFCGGKPSECGKETSSIGIPSIVASSGMKAYLKCLQPRDYEAAAVTLTHPQVLVKKKSCFLVGIIRAKYDYLGIADFKLTISGN